MCSRAGNGEIAIDHLERRGIDDVDAAGRQIWRIDPVEGAGGGRAELAGGDLGIDVLRIRQRRHRQIGGRQIRRGRRRRTPELSIYRTMSGRPVVDWRARPPIRIAGMGPPRLMDRTRPAQLIISQFHEILRLARDLRRPETGRTTRENPTAPFRNGEGLCAFQPEKPRDAQRRRCGGPEPTPRRRFEAKSRRIENLILHYQQFATVKLTAR